MAQLRQITNRFTVAIQHIIAAGLLVALNMKVAVVDTDKWNELLVVVLDKKNLAVADFEFRAVGDFHCLVANRPTEHSDCIRRSRVAFDVLVDLKSDVSVDVPLCALAFPNGANIRDRALKNKFSLLHQLFESWRNHDRGADSDKTDGD